MFREMRRKQQQIDQELCIEVLKRNSTGVMGLIGDNGYPYTVPITYGYKDGCLYMHCAKKGYKLDLIARDPHASFTVIDQDLPDSPKFTNRFRSVICFGTAEYLESEEDRREAAMILTKQSFPEKTEDDINKMIDVKMPALGGIRFTIVHMTGKESRFVAQERTGKSMPIPKPGE